MRFLFAAILATSLVSPGLSEAGPFGPGRSEGRPTAKKAKPAKAKKAKKPVVDEDEIVIEEAPKKVAARKPEPRKPEPKKPEPKKAKVVDDEIATAEADDDEGLVIIEETAAPRKPEVAAKPMIGAKPTRTVEVEESDEEPDPVDDEEPDETDETDDPKRIAAADDDGDVLETTSITRSVAKAKPHKTRFYFRAGAMKQSTKLGAAQFSLDTELPIEGDGLGEGSGVETQQNQIPVGAIIGVVLPVLDRKLSLETVLGVPTPTRFKATGKLANESLAPTFMGMETGIEPLGPNLAEATFAPPIVTAVYRVAKLGPVTPVAGAGLMLLMARNAKVTNGVLNEAGDPKLSISPSPGLVLQGGLDIQLWKRVAARIDIKYVLGMKVNATIEDIAVTPKAIPALGSLEVGDATLSAKVAPLIIQAGVGVDF